MPRWVTLFGRLTIRNLLVHRTALLLDEALTLDRTSLENTVAEKMRILLDQFECGVQIVKVNLKKVDPPDDVRDAFNAVNRAMQIRDRIVNEAEGEVNKKLPVARGRKERAVKEAEGYKIGRLNRAKGETDAFLAVLQEYEKAEDITRRRLYLESMARALPRSDSPCPRQSIIATLRFRA